VANDTLDALALAPSPPQRSAPPGDERLRAAIDTTLAAFLRHECTTLESNDHALRPFAALASDSVLASWACSATRVETGKPRPGEISRTAEIVADTGAVAMVDAMIDNRVSAALGALALAATQPRS